MRLSLPSGRAPSFARESPFGASEFRIVASASCIDELLLSSLPDEESLLLIIDIGIDAAGSVEQVRRFKEANPARRIAVLVVIDLTMCYCPVG